MKFPKYITKEQIRQLEYEVLSKDFYIFLTRYLLEWAVNVTYIESVIARKNKLINLSNTICGDKIYVLESDDMGSYLQAEYDWHDSHFLLIFRKLDTIEFIEFVGELLRSDLIEIDFINQALLQEKASFHFIEEDGNFSICVHNIDEIDGAITSEDHPNIRLLVSRMDLAVNNGDYSGVLLASASIFETMAKQVVGISSIQDKTLKSFFDRYKSDSELPSQILDFILETYEQRNITPLAGHGSLKQPKINKKQAIILAEITKTFVRIERKLQQEKINTSIN
jgi:hypothetical protein